MKSLLYILVVISLVGTISGKSLKLLPPDVMFLNIKCTKFDFDWGFSPDPAGGAYSAPPDPLDSRGLLVRGRREGEGNGEEKALRGGKERAKGSHITLIIHYKASFSYERLVRCFRFVCIHACIAVFFCAATVSR